MHFEVTESKLGGYAYVLAAFFISNIFAEKVYQCSSLRFALVAKILHLHFFGGPLAVFFILVLTEGRIACPMNQALTSFFVVGLPCAGASSRGRFILSTPSVGECRDVKSAPHDESRACNRHQVRRMSKDELVEGESEQHLGVRHVCRSGRLLVCETGC